MGCSQPDLMMNGLRGGRKLVSPDTARVASEGRQPASHTHLKLAWTSRRERHLSKDE